MPYPIVASYNGTGFASNEFDEFLKGNGIRHVFSAPYHPSSNGQADNGSFGKNV